MTELTEFKNLRELMATISDEAIARQYMERMRWGSEPFCPHCLSTKPYRLADGKNFRCSNKTCRKDFSVTVKTIFENSKVPLVKWLAALFLITAHKKGISSVQLAKDIGVTQKSAWFMNHRIRHIMGDTSPQMLDNIVEVDETYVGGKWENMTKGRRHKLRESGGDNKVPVMGLVERNGNAKLTIIGKNSFKDIVRLNVDKSATVMTDSHIGYVGLSQEYSGHHAVNHSQSEYRRGLAYTNTVEGFFSCLKRSIYGCYHRVSPKHLQRYCHETSYRYNTRQIKDVDRFKMAVSNVEGRLKYKTLIQNT